jgi:hypothetical protein
MKKMKHQHNSYHGLYKTGLGLITGFVFLSFLFFFAGCQKNIPVPQHLIGVWKTSAPQYEDRYLKITEDSLTYGIGNGEEVSHSIDKIDVEQENGETVYTFHYKDKEGEKWDLTLIYSPVDGTIKLKHKNDIWEKVKSESPEK